MHSQYHGYIGLGISSHDTDLIIQEYSGFSIRWVDWSMLFSLCNIPIIVTSQHLWIYNLFHCEIYNMSWYV